MVTSTATKVQYNGNSATTVFAYPFVVTSSAQLVVVTTTRRR